MHRNTYAVINLKNIKHNVKTLMKKYSHKYYIGVVKADAYGHGATHISKALISSGINYLAVATLDEALEIRQKEKQIPILCLGIIPIEYIKECINNNITITISNYKYTEELIKNKTYNIKVHIKLNTGMNRLGIKTEEEFIKTYNLLKTNNIFIEGIYSHIYDSMNKTRTQKQYNNFKKITKSVDLSTIPMIHINASDLPSNFKKPNFTNTWRMGIAIYGLSEVNKDLLSTYSLYSEVIEINDIQNETVGYSGKYKAKGKERIAVIPIGYADGIIRKNTNRYVYINDKRYKIVGNICMDMLFVKVDKNVKVKDTVILIKDKEHIQQIAKHLKTIPYEVICSIGKRVPKKYI